MRVGILLIFLVIFTGLGIWFISTEFSLSTNPELPNIPPTGAVEGFRDYTLIDSIPAIYIKRKGEKIKPHQDYPFDASKYKVVRLPKNLLLNLPELYVDRNDEFKLYRSSNNLFVKAYLNIKSMRFLKTDTTQRVEEFNKTASEKFSTIKFLGKREKFPMENPSKAGNEKLLEQYCKDKNWETRICNYEVKRVFSDIYSVHQKGLDESVDRQWLKDNKLTWKTCDNNYPYYLIYNYEKKIFGNGICIRGNKKIVWLYYIQRFIWI